VGYICTSPLLGAVGIEMLDCQDFNIQECFLVFILNTFSLNVTTFVLMALQSTPLTLTPFVFGHKLKIQLHKNPHYNQPGQNSATRVEIKK